MFSEHDEIPAPRRGVRDLGSPCEADPDKRHRSAKAAEPVAAGLDPPRLQRPPCLRGRRAVGAAGRAAIAAEAMPGGLEAWRNRARPDPRRIVRREELLGMILLNAAPRVRGIFGPMTRTYQFDTTVGRVMIRSTREGAIWRLWLNEQFLGSFDAPELALQALLLGAVTWPTGARPARAEVPPDLTCWECKTALGTLP